MHPIEILILAVCVVIFVGVGVQIFGLCDEKD